VPVPSLLPAGRVTTERERGVETAEAEGPSASCSRLTTSRTLPGLARVRSLRRARWTSRTSGSSTSTALRRLCTALRPRPAPRRAELAALQLEDAGGPGEVAVTVRDDRELDPLHNAVHTLPAPPHPQGGGVHHHVPDGDVAVGADAHHLGQTVVPAPRQHLGPGLPEVVQPVTELLPLLRLEVGQPGRAVRGPWSEGHLLSMKRRTVKLPSSLSEVMWTNLSPFLVS
jgi:hypothetical protein